jgi:hypothetical protein
VREAQLSITLPYQQIFIDEITLTSHIIEAQQASERQERIGAHAHTKAHGPHREAHMQLIRRRHASRRGTGHT